MSGKVKWKDEEEEGGAEQMKIKASRLEEVTEESKEGLGGFQGCDRG